MYSEPNISITPSRLSVYTRVLNNDGSPFRRPKSTFKLPVSNATKGNVSFRSTSRLKDKINWLCYLAKNQTVTYPGGNISTKFRISMITLTLPSRQVHTDLEIKRVFNNFLTTLRKRYNLKHYVWKAELQRNDNIHFHLTSTLFINYHTVRTLWNNAINRLGYVDRYRDRFSQLSFDQYCQIYGANMKKYGRDFDIKKCEKSFNDGSKSGWTSPNSTDVKTVFNVDNLAAYMAKYLSKRLSKNGQTDRVLSFGGHIWHCSRSLSKLTAYSDLFCNQWADVRDFITLLKSSYSKVFDFCECTFFNLQKLPIRLRNSLRKILDGYISRTFQQFDISY